MSKKAILWLSLGTIAVICAAFFVFKPVATARAYGSPIDYAKGIEVPFEKVFSNTENYVEKEIIVEGKVAQVCQTSGCWLILTDGANQLLVQFFDFTVKIKPGTNAKVQGQLRVQNGAPYLPGRGLEILR
jgi:hypothetical protein